jgi:ParB family chromosome partitioning protein
MPTDSTDTNKLNSPNHTMENIATKTICDPDVFFFPITPISIKINSLEPDSNSPRKLFEPTAMEKLKNSIQLTKYVQPLTIRENPENPGSYLIIDGIRRWKACQALGYTHIKCYLTSASSLESKIIAFRENIHRDTMTAMEKAIILNEILMREKERKPDFMQKDLIPIVNLSRTKISELINISKLDEEIQKEALKSKSWSMSKLLILAATRNRDFRFEKFQKLKNEINKRSAPLSNKAEDMLASETEDNLLYEKERAESKRALRFNKNAQIFLARLLKFSKFKLSKEDLEMLRPVGKSLRKALDDLLQRK